MDITIVFFIWLVMLIIGIDLFVSFGIASILYMITNDYNLLNVPQRIVMAANSFPLLAAPFFILMGNVMNASGVTKRIFEFAIAVVGWIRGGLGHANVVASMIFAGMSGSAVAEAGALGTIEVEAMTKNGYSRDFSAALTAAAATMGPIIPPSLPMVIYAVLADVSVGNLFLAGIIPGVLMGLTLMVYVYFYARKRNMPKDKLPKFSVLFKATREAFWALMAPILLMGGILSGVFTPTEAAAFAAFYALFIGYFVYKDFKLKDLPSLLFNTVETTGVVLALVMTAVLFGWNLTVSQATAELGKMLTGFSGNPLLFILLINIFLLMVGCFMEAIAAMMILVPILAPVALQLGINPIQFGLIVVLNLMIGTLTPPVGVVLYITSKVANISFEAIVKAIWPFLIPLLIVLVLVSAFPPLTTLLPKLIMGMK
jgi:tripartite ATP-independent transporter DctM subunit